MEFLIQDKADNKIYDVSEIVSDVSYTTELNSVGKLTFSYLKQGRMFIPGSIVRFKYNETKVFYGYIFKAGNTESEMLTVTAYDQLRYLKYKDGLMIENFTVGKLVKFICDKQKLKWGMVEDSKFKLVDKLFRGKTYLDMIQECIDETLIGTKKKYILYDDFGNISLKEAKNLKLPIMIGDESFAYGYSYTRSIDGETYNRIKIAQKQQDKNGDTFLNQTYVVDDPATQAKWGVLQYYEEVDENMDKTRIMQRANDLLRLYNNEERKLSLPCLGDARVRAGTSIRVLLSNLGIDKYFIVKNVSHSFGKVHTMDLELIII